MSILNAGIKYGFKGAILRLLKEAYCNTDAFATTYDAPASSNLHV